MTTGFCACVWIWKSVLHLQPSQVQISWTWSTVWWWAGHSQLAGSEPKALCGWRHSRDNWPGTRSWALSPWSGLKIPLEVPSGTSWCPCGRVCLFLFLFSKCLTVFSILLYLVGIFQESSTKKEPETLILLLIITINYNNIIKTISTIILLLLNIILVNITMCMYFKMIYYIIDINICLLRKEQFAECELSKYRLFNNSDLSEFAI